MKNVRVGAANQTDSAAPVNPIVKITSREVQGDTSRSWFIRPLWSRAGDPSYKVHLFSHIEGNATAAKTICELEIAPRKMKQFLAACSVRSLSIAHIFGSTLAEVIQETLDIARAVGDLPPVQVEKDVQSIAQPPASAPLAVVESKPLASGNRRITLEFTPDEWATLEKAFTGTCATVPMEFYLESEALGAADSAIHDDEEIVLGAVRNAIERTTERAHAERCLRLRWPAMHGVQYPADGPHAERNAQ